MVTVLAVASLPDVTLQLLERSSVSFDDDNATMMMRLIMMRCSAIAPFRRKKCCSI
jgi:hypothetical protein